jgi:hypothetical protein
MMRSKIDSAYAFDGDRTDAMQGASDGRFGHYERCQFKQSLYDQQRHHDDDYDNDIMNVASCDVVVQKQTQYVMAYTENDGGGRWIGGCGELAQFEGQSMFTVT